MPQTQVEWEKIAEEFHTKWNYPFCIGALDGKHIAIRPPANSGSQFYNYKHFFSLVLLAMVDANYKFIYVNVGANGRTGDAGIFRDSSLKKALDERSLRIPPPDVLAGAGGCSYHIIADEAFPLREDLMKPYPHRNLTEPQMVFNYRLSRARRVVENAFGIMANRFRVFQTTINLKPDKVESIVLAACCLHNYLRDRTTTTTTTRIAPEEIEGSDNVCPSMTSIQATHSRNASQAAKEQRERLREFFSSEHGSVEWQNQMI